MDLKISKFVFILSVLCFFSFSGGLYSQDVTDPSGESAKKLEQIQSELTEKKAQLEEIQKKEKFEGHKMRTLVRQKTGTTRF